MFETVCVRSLNKLLLSFTHNAIILYYYTLLYCIPTVYLLPVAVRLDNKETPPGVKWKSQDAIINVLIGVSFERSTLSGKIKDCKVISLELPLFILPFNTDNVVQTKIVQHYHELGDDVFLMKRSQERLRRLNRQMQLEYRCISVILQELT